MQAKLQELERKYELQAAKHAELTQEMSQLRREADQAKQLPLVANSEMQTERERRRTPATPELSNGMQNSPRPDVGTLKLGTENLNSLLSKDT